MKPNFQNSNKPKWTSTKYYPNPNQKASCFDISPDGSSFLIGDDSGQLITLCISYVIYFYYLQLAVDYCRIIRLTLTLYIFFMYVIEL